MNYDGITTIQLRRSTKRRLDKFKNPGESYDDAVNAIITEYLNKDDL